MALYCRHVLWNQRALVRRTYSMSAICMKESPLPNDDNDTQDIDIEDHFKTLKLPRKFVIDEKDVKQTYKKLMIRFHPDKYANEPLPEQENAHMVASSITRAYSIISQPIHRSNHLLHLITGENPIDEDRETDDNELVGQDFLLESMETFEAIEDAPATSSSNNDPLQNIQTDNSDKINDIIINLAKAFEVDDISLATSLSAQLRYLVRIQELIRQKIDL